MMNEPPVREEPRDPAEVARRQARLEQQLLETRLEIMQTHRKQRESTASRRLSFFLVFALSASVAWIVDHKGYPPQIVIGSAVVTIVVFSGFWAFRKPY